jgi:hypothetical protein
MCTYKQSWHFAFSFQRFYKDLVYERKKKPRLNVFVGKTLTKML